MITAVLLKQVTFVCSRTGSDPQQGFVSEADRVTLNNPLDEVALEQAVRLKNNDPGDAVWVFCLGDHVHEPEARRAFALGADHFVFLSDSAWSGMDAWATAGVLSRAVRKVSATLLLCGAASLDRGMGEVGAFTARRLALPYISDVVKCAPLRRGSLLSVERALDQGAREVLEAEIPLAIGMGAGAGRPGYPSFSARRLAAGRPILRWRSADLPPAPDDGVSRVRPGSVVSPKPRPRRVALPDGGLNAYERIDRLLAGAEGSKSGAVLEGDPQVMARRLLAFLLEKQLIPQREKD